MQGMLYLCYQIVLKPKFNSICVKDTVFHTGKGMVINYEHA